MILETPENEAAIEAVLEEADIEDPDSPEADEAIE